MLKRLKKIEKELLAIYAEIKEQAPYLCKISFEVQGFDHLSKPRLGGFWHIGDECESYDNISEIAAFIHKAKERRAKNEILYYNFKGVV